ncbi:hypothetical protein [Salinibaculum rarum]|uniref:Nmad3 family putative nucleotide modification protein n=1 Tax=Salinibaculum rarum TaxID=3058903 RepID=UPI00265D9F75|nr:hypothetical protein [Salinibaculum sp. KK48]
MRAIAINVGANTNEPGFRGPVWPDGRFEYIPIPESEPAVDPPTYGDLAPTLETSIPDELLDRPVHLDPEFPEYPRCERYTYGDDHCIKAGPLSELDAGDYVLFYATLSVRAPADWLPPEWGAFCIGHFRLAEDAMTGEEYATLGADGQAPFTNNAHVRRDPPAGAQTDARVLLRGDPDESMLYDRVIPLSQPSGGTDANALVTELSADSGKGPWWRRPLRFDTASTPKLRAVCDSFASGLESYQH